MHARRGNVFHDFSETKTTPHLPSRSTLSLTLVRDAVLLCLALALMMEQSEAAKALPNAVETKEYMFVVAKVLGEGACLRMVCKLSCACLLVRHAVHRHAMVEAWLH